jgi:hypothetical protein
MKLPRRRERDDSRSVGSHPEIMGALGRAAGWDKVDVGNFDFVVRTDGEGKPAQEQTLKESPHSAFVPGKSTAVKFNDEEPVRTSYKSIVKGK